MKYKWIRSVIFYSEGLGSERGTHLSLISLVSHVMWDWSERERKPLWLPPPSSVLLLSVTATHKPFWCVRSSPPPLMSVLVDTVANGYANRPKKERGGVLHLCFRCTWTLDGLNKSDVIFLISSWRFALMKLSGFQAWNANLVPWGSSPRILQLLSSAERLRLHLSGWRCFKQTEWWGAKEVSILKELPIVSWPVRDRYGQGI